MGKFARLAPKRLAGFRQQVCLGHVVGISREGAALVDFPGNLGGPRQARSVLTIAASVLADETRAPAVLLLFENEDPCLPVIIGLVGDRFVQPGGPPLEARVDGKRVALTAEQEISLVCGDSSITLRRDGKIVIKGANLLSRSSGPNKIRGTEVDIN